MPDVDHAGRADVARPALWRITDRQTFQELRRRGRRARRGPLTVTWLASTDETATRTRAGFTIGKATGGAVVRNRVRRRLRAALRALLADGRLRPGTYLLGGGPELATMPWSELVSLVGDTCDEARR
ncbi:MAG: ribonuclease P protein component [Acidimicrobiales bacterium]